MGADFVQDADYFFVGNLPLTEVLRCAKIILLSHYFIGGFYEKICCVVLGCFDSVVAFGWM
jgi:hypothetical protein